MTVDHETFYVDRARATELPSGGLRRWLVELAPQDWVVLSYLTMLNVVVLLSPEHPARLISFARVFVLFATYAVIAGTVRARIFTHPVLAPFAYRLAALFCVQLTYFAFADLLPVVSSVAYDHQLHRLDLALFGIEPAAFMDRFVTPVTNEWFAFFYFGYFFALSVHTVLVLFFTRWIPTVAHFAFGLLLVFCIGHTLYMVVPGYGPYKAMPELFHHVLPRGVWWDMTTDIVAQSGAQKDIFPSLHTAAPTFILLFTFHHRHRAPYRYTWPLVAFFWVNIVLATMFLRWHYVIDVVAGLLLACFAHVTAVYVTRREAVRREALGIGPIWPEWFATPVGVREPRSTNVAVPGE